MTKKLFASLLAAGLLFSGCGDKSSSDKNIHFEITKSDKPQLTPVEIATADDCGDTVVVEKDADAIRAFVSKSADDMNKSPDSKGSSLDKIDWDNAPRINNQLDLVNHLKSRKFKLEPWAPVVFTDGYKPDLKELVSRTACWQLTYWNYGGDNQTTYMLFKMTVYPGERVAYAYLHNDTSFLNMDELVLYNVATEIVEEANDFSGDNSTFPEIYKELSIHDEITDRATYYTENPQPSLARFQTAIGALIDGKANCQGYTDAFYMLGTMCGFKVDKIFGTNHGMSGSHVWNTINFGDDRYYFVDVTWDDANFTFGDGDEWNGYVYFNAPADVASATHIWDNEYVPRGVYQNPDGRYFFYTQEFTNSDGELFGAHSLSAEDALNYIAYRIATEDFETSWVCAPYDANYANGNASVKYLTNLLNQYGWRGKFDININPRGKYMFFTVDALPRT